MSSSESLGNLQILGSTSDLVSKKLKGKGLEICVLTNPQGDVILNKVWEPLVQKYGRLKKAKETAESKLCERDNYRTYLR